MTAMLPVDSEQAMLALLRARRDELGITHETLDWIAGFPTGWTSKVLANPPSRRMGAETLALALWTLGYGVALFEDETRLARLKARLPQAVKAKRYKIGKPWLFTRKNASEMGRRGVSAKAEKRLRMERISERNRGNIRKRWAKRGICAPARATNHAL